MTILSSSDFLDVKLASLIADYDRDTLANLYQPIIGYASFALYMTLWSEANNERISSLCSHEQILCRMQMNPGALVDARKYLEAMGLLKTCVDKENDFKIYHYELYAPKTPKEFFSNALFYGMLIKCIGEGDANRLKALYTLDKKQEYGKDVSANFSEVFHPEFDDPIYLKAINEDTNIKGRNNSKVKGDFSYEEFFNCLKQVSQISENSFNKKDMKEIERLATLYGVNEMVAANHVSNIFNPMNGKGKYINYEELSKLFRDETNFAYIVSKSKTTNKPNLVSGKTSLASKINLMETVSPKDYLSILQNGTKAASSDLRLIDDLSKNFKLANCVLNALIDFVLTTNNNILSRPLCEKISASLAREGVTTTIDAMNFLKKVKKPRKASKVSTLAQEEIITDSKKEKEDDGISWAQMLDDIDDGGSDGKA